MWVALVDGGLVHGGFASDSRGHVTRRAGSDGVVAWQAYLDRMQDPETPGTMITGG